MLNQVMANPQAMEQMMSLAKRLGLQGGQNPGSPSPQPPPQNRPAPPQNRPAPPQQSQPSPGPDPMQLMQSLLKLSQQGGGDERQIALFQALKPFVSRDRAEKLDRAIQIARISRLAGNALQSLGPQFFQAGDAHV